jgi:hypothetical protein
VTAALTWIEQHAALAAWLQTISVIAALVAALILPARQRRAEAQGREQERRVRARALAVTFTPAVAALVAGAPAVCAELEAAAPAGQPVTYANLIARRGLSFGFPAELQGDAEKYGDLRTTGDLLIKLRVALMRYGELRNAIEGLTAASKTAEADAAMSEMKMLAARIRDVGATAETQLRRLRDED